MGRLEARIHRWVVMIAALIAVAVVSTIGGGSIEGYLSPVRANQDVGDIVRTDARLCWRWSSDKLRPALSDNIDVFLVDPTGERSSAAIFVERTGQPWRLGGSAPKGYQSERFCVLVPPYLKRETPVTVLQQVYYRGWHDLWTVPVRVPDVVFPGATS